MDENTIFVESVSGDGLMVRRRNDGDFYVETRGVNVMPSALVIPKDEASVLAHFLTS